MGVTSYFVTKLPYSTKFWRGEFWRIQLLKCLTENILMDSCHLSPYTCKHYTVFKQFDELNFDGLAQKHQKRQNFPPSKFCTIQYIKYHYTKRLAITLQQSLLQLLFNSNQGHCYLWLGTFYHIVPNFRCAKIL